MDVSHHTLSLSLSSSFQLADYMGIDMPTFGPFSNTMRQQCVDISVVLDTDPESNENFKVTVTEDEDGVSVVPSGAMTTVTIIDCEYA